MEKYRNLIAQGKLRQLANALKNELPLSRDTKDEITIIVARLSELERQQREGVIRDDEVTLKRQQISKAF